MDVVEDLCHPLSQQMWSVHGDLDNGPSLIFPFKRTGTVRVSEQESRVLLCQVLESSPWFYSVETPTLETYSQTGASALSGRIDVTVHGTRSAVDRVLNVELKAGLPSLESLHIDFEKLVPEAVDGLWFHTLERTNSANLQVLLGRMRQAIDSVGEEGLAAGHTLSLALCLLDKRVLLSANILLGVDLESQLGALFGVDGAAWRVFGPGTDAYTAVAVPVRAPLRQKLSTDGLPIETKVREKFLFYCPQITSTASSFLHIYSPTETIDVRNERISVQETEAWAGVIAAHNRRLGIGS
ncbi:hypothetical protein [Cryobacterium sp. M25]|uniref:hypothetical protein n=1 Tax=Cryobacterium sp. M25 TaxID=2048293 RepID=UPI000CE38D10|nr:hypothetical protein [Cryobacterium sp. M25]